MAHEPAKRALGRSPLSPISTGRRTDSTDSTDTTDSRQIFGRIWRRFVAGLIRKTACSRGSFKSSRRPGFRQNSRSFSVSFLRASGRVADPGFQQEFRPGIGMARKPIGA